MQIKIGSHIIDKFNEVNVTLRYNSVADTFGFSVYFDENNAASKSALKPGSYADCVISHKGKDLIYGTFLSPSFSSSAQPTLTGISGYSKTGMLQECNLFTWIINEQTGQIQDTKGSIQFNNQNLEEITNRLLAGTGLGLCVVDPTVTDECAKVFTHTAADATESIADYLDKLATQRNIVLSHTIDGRVLFTKCRALGIKKLVPIMSTALPDPIGSGRTRVPEFTNTGNSVVNFDAKPIYHFKPGQTVWTKMDLNVNGQTMHSYIEVLGQVAITPEATVSNDSRTVIKNPYVKKTFRYKRVVQTSGDDNDTPDTARSILGAELRAITLTIDIEGWELNGNIVTPNQIITAYNPPNYLYKTTRFFIESVDYIKNAKTTKATLHCVLPEVYNDEDVVNIFD